MLSPDLAGFLESGVSIVLGTRDAYLLPECVRVQGARVELASPERSEVTLLVPCATGATTVANLRDNGRVAAFFGRARDHRSIQLKGRALAVRDADARDRECVERYRALLTEMYTFVGIPPRLTRRLAHWPCHAVRFLVEGVFLQTPGPGAGEPLAPPAASASAAAPAAVDEVAP